MIPWGILMHKKLFLVILSDILVIMSTMLFLQFTLYSFFDIPSKATPGVALEVEQPGIAQLSPGISHLITELIAIRNLTSARFYSV